ncbi:rsbT co-antagonist protein RsbR [Alkalihalobacillus xiaoxiensis]|uniref:RsbT co-antagonist protein RsbR n=1 Tax=Shouchella xiaoxiensis TaxID=766895 RepID=A0ABS2SP98_9BACI|nr:STAS domain-containing protein [Shouchella xiaoxiensis]MBM7837352.1 rsbT co-antagonist protein RsbR [Shouchella xiaoxiensis]
MIHSQSLYDFLMNKLTLLVEDWVDSERFNGKEGDQLTNNITKAQRKEQALSFHSHFLQMFRSDYDSYAAGINQWLETVGMSEGAIQSNTTERLKDLFQTQNQYVSLVDDFFEDEFADEKELAKKQIIEEMQALIVKITQLYEQIQEKQELKKKEIISQLSTPIISLNRYVALLPLVGEIEAAHVSDAFETILEECSKRNVNHLLIDLSGLYFMDTMFAHQIQKLVQSLLLTGVQVSLSGMRPQIAQTSVHLGIQFQDVHHYQDVERAMNHLNNQYLKISM